MRVAVLDYGVGNLHSLTKALEVAGARVQVVREGRAALFADALVLPGVGAFGSAASVLGEWAGELRAALASGFPCLGICLGMQLLFDESEEGEGRGLGAIPGGVVRLRAPVVPHMGWNRVECEGDPLFGAAESLVAYFAHSFVCEPRDPACVSAWVEYGGVRFTAAVRSGNVFGVQFHPEKSSRAGLELLRRFLDLVRRGR
jgi:glutamine amidotransferase